MSEVTNSSPSTTPSALREKVRSLSATPSLRESLATYLAFLGHGDAEPIYLHLIDPREQLRGSTATAVASNLEEAIGLLGTADQYIPQGSYVWGNRIKSGVELRYPLGKWAVERNNEGIKDSDISSRRVVYIDCDVTRDAGDGKVGGISATKTETNKGIERALVVADVLSEILGGSDSLGFGMSGNGGQLHVALDSLPLAESQPLVTELLGVLAVLYDGDGVFIDTGVGDARRIGPCWGTRKRKGARPAADRPWRQTFFIAASETVERLSLDKLKALLDALKARLSPEQVSKLAEIGKKKTAPTPSSIKSTDGIDIFALANAVPYREAVSGQGVSPDSCPGCGNQEGDDSSFYGKANLWHCFRSTCQATSPKGKGNWGAIDAVAKAKDIKPREAAKAICEAAGIAVPGRGRPRKKMTKEALVTRAEALGIELDEEPSNDVEPAIKTWALTDLGNGERLVHRHGKDIRWVGTWGHWMTWSGTRWARDESDRVVGLMHDTARHILHEAVSVETDEERSSYAGWASASEGRDRTVAAISQAKPYRAITHRDLNQAPLILNTPAGTIELNSGVMREHRREELLTTITGVHLEAGQAPTWKAFLARVQPDVEVRSFLQRLIGASVLGVVREHILPIHNGIGRNGKGTFFETLLEVLGDYACAVPEELLIESRNSDHPTLLANLYGKRLAVASETKQGDALAMARIKRLTGGDSISCRRMREDWWDFTPSHQLHLQTNHRPRVSDPGLAAWARLLLIDWAVTIPEGEQDKDLRSKLRAEGPAILSWIVEGARLYLVGGLDVPESVRAATAEWRAEEDVLGMFLSEQCEVGIGKAVEVGGLYDVYRAWAEASGCHPLAKNRLTKELVSRGFTAPTRGTGGTRSWAGIGLREPGTNPGLYLAYSSDEEEMEELRQRLNEV